MDFGDLRCWMSRLDLTHTDSYQIHQLAVPPIRAQVLGRWIQNFQPQILKELLKLLQPNFGDGQ